MKIIAILGGLGSQMMKYAFYLSVKEACKDEECLIDTTPFLTMNMWNGYELKRIFNIDDEDLRSKFSDSELKNIAGKSYRDVSLNKLNIIFPEKQIVVFDRGYECAGINITTFDKLKLKVKRLIRRRLLENKNDEHIDKYPLNYLSIEGITYFDEFNHTSDYYFHSIKNKLRDAFSFPNFNDIKNKTVSCEMLNCESVAFHIRRSDHMYDNKQLFKNGYFNKAVGLIKNKTRDLVFYIFSDEPDWCMENIDRIGLTESDTIIMVNWNKSVDSYKDMQLMTYCKHNILVISSFSWWGYYLSRNLKGKIACAPNGYWFDVENHF